jgi:hypothetical protein
MPESQTARTLKDQLEAEIANSQAKEAARPGHLDGGDC